MSLKTLKEQFSYTPATRHFGSANWGKISNDSLRILEKRLGASPHRTLGRRMSKKIRGGSHDVYENKGPKSDILEGPTMLMKTNKIWIWPVQQEQLW